MIASDCSNISRGLVKERVVGFKCVEVETEIYRQKGKVGRRGKLVVRLVTGSTAPKMGHFSVRSEDKHTVSAKFQTFVL